MVTNAPIVPALAARRDELIRCRPGRIVGREDMRPASFMNATIEPVNVMPPKIANVSVYAEMQSPPGESGVITDENAEIGCDHV